MFFDHLNFPLIPPLDYFPVSALCISAGALFRLSSSPNPKVFSSVLFSPLILQKTFWKEFFANLSELNDQLLIRQKSKGRWRASPTGRDEKIRYLERKSISRGDQQTDSVIQTAFMLQNRIITPNWAYFGRKSRKKNIKKYKFWNFLKSHFFFEKIFSFWSSKFPTVSNFRCQKQDAFNIFEIKATYFCKYPWLGKITEPLRNSRPFDRFLRLGGGWTGLYLSTFQ